MSPSIWHEPLPTSSNKRKSTVAWAKGRETLKGEGEQPNKFSENYFWALLTVLGNVPSKTAGVKGSQVCHERCAKLLEQVVHIMEGILVLIVVEKQWGTWSFLTTQQKPMFSQSSLAWRDVTCRRQSFWDCPGDPGVRQYKEAQAFTFSSGITPSTLRQFWCFTHLPHELRRHYL